LASSCGIFVDREWESKRERGDATSATDSLYSFRLPFKNSRQSSLSLSLSFSLSKSLQILLSKNSLISLSLFLYLLGRISALKCVCFVRNLTFTYTTTVSRPALSWIQPLMCSDKAYLYP
jgi:hypothetical protein